LSRIRINFLLTKEFFARTVPPCRGTQPQWLPATPGTEGETPKKIPETDAIFANIDAKDSRGEEPSALRVRMDCKATVKIGEYSRGGKTSGDNKAADHDMGCQEKYTIRDEAAFHSHPVRRGFDWQAEAETGRVLLPLFAVRTPAPRRDRSAPGP
jgi:hypothetical protein